MALYGNATFREFQSTITSNGNLDYNGITQPIYYYPKTGNAQLLNPGEQASWYTKFSEYELKLSFPNGNMAIDLGVKYTIFEAPTELRVSQYSNNGNLLMYTENKMLNFFIATLGYSPLGAGFYFKLYIPVSMAIPGCYSVKSDYFDSGPVKPFSNYGNMTMSSTGNLAFLYVGSFIKLELGLDYSFTYSWMSLKDAALKKDVVYFDNYDKQNYTISAGQQADISVTRMELFWGFYLTGSIFF